MNRTKKFANLIMYFIFLNFLVSSLLTNNLNYKQISLKSNIFYPKSSYSTSNVSFLALGDSYTIGQSVAYNERWPVQLSTRLQNSGYNVGPVEFIAQTGWTTADLSTALFREPSNIPYNLVSLLIGVNDQYKGISSEDYRTNFKYLLNLSIRYAGNNPNHVFVVSIPDYGVTPFINDDIQKDVIKKEIDLFNLINYDESINANVHYINITSISRRASDNLSLLTYDSLHPSGKMYSEWVDAIEPVIKPLVGILNEDSEKISNSNFFSEYQNYFLILLFLLAFIGLVLYTKLAHYLISQKFTGLDKNKQSNVFQK
ncbi:SGNH/GDSL hydrolase family protein [Promethearchaeum syntrophicum]|uniref:SGNH/GDSL hydrolase family protein n=1 Tax=Promethearchaeum syntrophicum TaxID=2594042 RepID=A0A5B9D7Y8_9ARCH|nr:GDSL-type esterase/lipase family protein [Candidatus Prometheoarchaeum syntrophicum]QEE15135.1 GDSL-like Lipase/Acylhydrolase [Candidatus Prometheoarchaeum syntrophicum]